MPKDHRAFIGLSNWQRSKDLNPMRQICSGKAVLDLGCHYGLTSYDALDNGASKIFAIDSDPECVKVAKQILCESKATVIEQDLTVPESLSRLGFKSGDFDTVFYLALHQHLAHRSPGSETSLLNEIVGLSPMYIVFRGKGFTNNVSKFLANNFGRMCFYGAIDIKLGAVIIFENVQA